MAGQGLRPWPATVTSTGSAMTRYVAFLRAINVGGHTVKMDRLRALFAAPQCSDVSTFIASGNVIFGTRRRAPDALEARIEAHLASALGYDVATFVRPVADLPAIASLRPFPTVDRLASDGGAVWIGFLKAEPAPEVRQRIEAMSSDLDRLRVDGREVYWSCRTRMTDSVVSTVRLEKVLGARATFRNVTTVRKIAETFAGA